MEVGHREERKLYFEWWWTLRFFPHPSYQPFWLYSWLQTPMYMLKTQILIIRIERSPVFSIQVYRHLRIWMYLVINTRCKQLPLLKSFLKASLLWFPHSEIHITILTISPNRNTEAMPDFYIPIQPLILKILLPMYFSKLFISLDLILTTPTKDSVYLT